MMQRLLLMFVLYFVFSCFEWWHPAEREQPAGERFRNIALGLVFILFGGLVTRLLLWNVSWSVAVAQRHGLPYSVLVVLLCVFVSDLIFYWYHRAQHTLAWLWIAHELHHSDAHMNATTSLRTSWLESPIQAILIGVPVSLISHVDTRAIFLLPIILTVWLVFTHANWRLHLGWFAPVLTGPQLHRIHHSILPEHRDKNFAQFFPVIDVVFGTYAHPSPTDFPRTGTPSLPTRVPASTVLVGPLKAG